MKSLKYLTILLFTFQLNAQESKYQKDIEIAGGVQLMAFKLSDGNKYFTAFNENSDLFVNFTYKLVI